MENTKKIIAFDVGGTCIKYGVFDEKLSQLLEGTEPTCKNPGDFLQQLYHIIDTILTKNREIAGISLSIPGFVNPATGENTDFTVGANFTQYNLKEKLSAYTGLPVVIENDSNCAALAESRIGAGKEYDSFMTVTVGTGIGAALIHEGQLIRGKNFKAGELGLVHIGEGRKPGATAALTAAVKEFLEAQGKETAEADGKYVFQHLEEPGILKIYKEWLYNLALVIGNAAVVLDEEAVLIGGGISAQHEFVKELEETIWEVFHLKGYTCVKPCVLGNNAGKAGAAILFFDTFI